jgi:hypothetical protein
MKRVHILVVIVGFLLMPALTFACGCHSEKKSCDKEVAAKSDKMDCCQKNTPSKDKTHKGCNGKCGHSNCVTTSTQYSAVFFELKFNNHNFDFQVKNQNYSNSNTEITSGYTSLWLIPKIS